VSQQLALVSEIVEWLRPAFAGLGYLIVSGAMFLESAALVGVVVPGDVILAVGGVYAAEGALSVPWVIACGVVFGTLGETTGYLLGRRFGVSLVKRLPFVGRFERKVDRARKSLRRNGGKAIVLGRFVTGVAGTVPFAAGTAEIDARTFFLFTIPTIVVWATGVVLLGYFVGDNVDTIDRILSAFGWAGFALVIVVIGGVWLYRRSRRKRVGEGSAT
jgi:membrane-associated protein